MSRPNGGQLRQLASSMMHGNALHDRTSHITTEVVFEARFLRMNFLSSSLAHAACRRKRGNQPRATAPLGYFVVIAWLLTLTSVRCLKASVGDKITVQAGDEWQRVLVTAPADSTIAFERGVFTGDCNVTLLRTVHLTGIAGLSTIRCKGSTSRLSVVGATVSIDGLIISGEDSTWTGQNGGCLSVLNGTLHIHRSELRNCSAENGGGLYAHGSSLLVADTSFVHNTAEFNGGSLFADQSKVLVTNSSFVDCSAGRGGAVALLNSVLNAHSDVTFQSNAAMLRSVDNSSAEPQSLYPSFRDVAVTFGPDEGYAEDYWYSFDDSVYYNPLDDGSMSSEGCATARTQDGLQGEIRIPSNSSANFYPNSADCKWRILPPALGEGHVAGYLLEFELFQLERSFDFVYIFVCDTAECRNPSPLHALSGWASSPFFIRIEGHAAVVIQFSSNELYVSKGFHLRYRTFVQLPETSVGGALYAISSQIDFASVVLEQNVARTGGGIFAEHCILHGRSSLIIRNAATDAGGGVYMAGAASDANFTNTTMLGNEASHGGAVLTFGKFQASNCTFAANHAGRGGAISAGGEIKLTRVALIENSAVDGGAVFASGPLTAAHCEFRKNSAAGAGGAVYSGEHAEIFATPMLENEASDGGAVFAPGPLHMSECQVRNNRASFLGGGVVGHTMIVLTGMQMHNNHGTYGGAVMAFGFLIATDSTLESNFAQWLGGGVLCAGFGCRFDQVQIVLNAALYGGGVFADRGFEIEASEVSMNSVPFFGGGLVLRGERNRIGGGVAVSNNSAQHGGGFYVDRGYVEFSGNVIVAQNEASDEGGGLKLTFDSTVLVHGGVTLQHNTANSGGGLYIAWNSMLDVRGRLQVVRNEAVYGGAVCKVDPSRTLIRGNLEVTRNTAEYGGGLYIESSLNVSGHAHVLGNTAREGGGAYLLGAMVSVEGSAAVSENAALLSGGGMYVYESAVEVRSAAAASFEDNSAQAGGGLDLRYSRLASGGQLQVRRNHATEGGGGGVYSYLSNVVLQGDGSAFVGNSASGEGGAVLSGSSYTEFGVTISASTTFANNSAGDHGGAVCCYDALTFAEPESGLLQARSAFEGNRADGAGGALAVHAPGLLEIRNSHHVDVRQNTAQHGGGIALLAGASFAVRPKKPCAPECWPDMKGDGRCQAECFSAACNWDAGDCLGLFSGDLPASAPCDRAACPLDRAAVGGNCTAECLRPSCDWGGAPCASLFPSPEECPVFDRAVLSWANESVFVRGGSAQGFGRCDAEGCRAPTAARPEGPWCNTLNDGGRIVSRLANGSWVDAGESWGYCSPRPRLPGAGFDYDAARVLQAASQTPGTVQTIASHPGCGAVPLTLSRNTARSLGGGLYQDSCVFRNGGEESAMCFFAGMRKDAGSDLVVYDGNEAELGGGAVFTACASALAAGSDCAKYLSTLVGAAVMPPATRSELQFLSNRAQGFGDTFATFPGQIRAWSVGSVDYTPGITPMSFRFELTDRLGQQVRVTELTRDQMRVEVQVCSRRPGDRLECSGSLLQSPEAFSLSPAAGNSSTLDGTPRAVQYCEVGKEEVAFRLSWGEEVEALLHGRCRPCQPGQALRVVREAARQRDVWSCLPCSSAAYVADHRNSSYSCQPCPRGGRCVGGQFSAATEDSTWTLDASTGIYLLSSCPPGTQLVNTAAGGFTRVRNQTDVVHQECRPCSSGTEYIVNPNGGRCMPCPAGARCLGGVLEPATPGAVWRVSAEDPDLLLLVACPPSHLLVNMTFDGVFDATLQQCAPCTPGLHYVLNPNKGYRVTDHCEPCPSGAVCDGSTLHGRIEGSVWEADMALGKFVLVGCPAGHALHNHSFAHQRCDPCPKGTECTARLCSGPCSACAPGTFKDAVGTAACEACAAGGFCAPTSADSCGGGFTACGAGTFNPQRGSSAESACQRCPDGMFQNERGATACKACAAGGFCPRASADTCGGGFLPCPAGTFNPREGGSSEAACEACPRGSYSALTRATSNATCTPCAPGTFGNVSGAARCQACLPGQFAAAGATACSNCVVGRYAANEGHAECVPCPYPLSSAPGSTTCSTCRSGFYLVNASASPQELLQEPDRLCRRCPARAECREGAALETLAIPLNFWRDSLRTAQVYQCYLDAHGQSTCLGSGLSSSNASRRHSVDARRTVDAGEDDSRYCAAGHRGPRCAVCTEAGHYFDHRSKRCEACSHRGLLALAAAVLGCFALIPACLLATHRVSCVARAVRRLAAAAGSVSEQRLQAKFKILVSFAQVFNTLGDVYGVRIHQDFSWWLQIFRALDFDILGLALPSACLSVRHRLLFVGVGPYILCLLVAAGLGVHYLLVRRWRAPADWTKSALVHRALYAVICIVYLLLPAVSRSIFSARLCQSFGHDDASGEERSYLLADLSLRCDAALDPEYRSLAAYFWVLFVLWPLLVPLGCFGVTFAVRHAVLAKRRTRLSGACRFLWRDYEPSFFWWEAVDLARKLLLTALILLVDTQHGARRLLRLVIATVVSVLYLATLAVARPFARAEDLQLACLSNLLLACCFTSGLALKLCQEGRWGELSCTAFLGLDDSRQATVFLVGMTAVMLGASLAIIAGKTISAVSAPTLRFAGSGREPVLELPKTCDFHLFFSHAWRTGQDQTHSVARRLQLLCPDIRIWLDVDRLHDISNLEGCVAQSAVFLVFLSDGYFRSPNCRRELYAAIQHGIPIATLIEPDKSKGGASPAELVEECRQYCTEEGPGAAAVEQAVFAEEAVAFVRVADFQLASLKTLVARILRHLPSSHGQASELAQGLRVPGELGPLGFKSPTTLLVCSHNAGAYPLALELQEAAVQGEGAAEVEVCEAEEALEAEAAAGRGACGLLLYLTRDTFCDRGGAVSRLVKRALQLQLPVALAHEQQAEKGGCPFSVFYDQTPSELQTHPLKLLDNVAVPLFSMAALREVSLRHLLRHLGARPLRPRRASSASPSFRSFRSLRSLRSDRGSSRRLSPPRLVYPHASSLSRKQAAADAGADADDDAELDAHATALDVAPAAPAAREECRRSMAACPLSVGADTPHEPTGECHSPRGGFRV